MLEYHVWFNLKPGAQEPEALAAVSAFLAQMGAAGESAGFRLAKNNGQPPRSKLGAYHAVVEFADQAALDSAMAQQAKRGIHSGGHGHMLKFVHDLHVEIFTAVTSQRPEGLTACEI
jgi:N-formylglutamate amidohydrolase